MVCIVQPYDIPYSKTAGKIQSATYPTLLKIKYSSIANHLNKTSLLTPAKVVRGRRILCEILTSRIPRHSERPEKRAICKFGQSNWLNLS
ncbi:hypothetical protein L873DRAFT_1808178 [Choiromyces venosus 120613-1]|uniref:Uncharacterized protein n=1 Tax=Choiromyces venosus 120613-1 TaxID=1336337 RepID=A0A3N4JJU8_9PEZI|nr:hypothetical protein L873DRAFT_1808178 [Choiromyces venosus 120613-1]